MPLARFGTHDGLALLLANSGAVVRREYVRAGFGRELDIFQRLVGVDARRGCASSCAGVEGWGCKALVVGVDFGGMWKNGRAFFALGDGAFCHLCWAPGLVAR